MGYEAETAPSKRLLGLGIAVLFHILLIYGLMSGLGRELVKKVQTTVNVAILEQPKPPPPPPPQEILEEQPETNRKPLTKTPKAFVPKVETAVKASTEAESAITSTSVSTAEATPMVREAPTAAPSPPAPAAPKKITNPRLMQGCSPPKYPVRSLEKGEEGLVVFKFLIGLDGAVKSSVLVQSSGFDRLDEAAKQAFQKCKFTPGMLDGSPRQAWVSQPFRWRLR